MYNKHSDSLTIALTDAAEHIYFWAIFTRSLSRVLLGLEVTSDGRMQATRNPTGVKFREADKSVQQNEVFARNIGTHGLPL